MIEILFGVMVVIVLVVIFWASNTLKEEYRYRNTLDQETAKKAKLDKDNQKKHTIGGRP